MVLTVHRPRVGHLYQLRWQLPSLDFIPRRAELELLRRLLLLIRAGPVGRASADAFGQQIRELLAATFVRHGINGADPSLHVHLFAYDSEKRELVCRGGTGPESHPLTKTPFPYGYDLIGTSFRSRKPIGWSRRLQEEAKEVHLFRFFPATELTCLLAYPLNWPRVSGWPAGVVALSAADKNSPLDTLLKSTPFAEAFMAEVHAVWLRVAPGMFPGHERLFIIDRS